MEIANSELGVRLPMWVGELYATAVERLVIPVEPLAIVGKCGLRVRHERRSAEPFRDHPLRKIPLSNPVAPLYRGYVAEAGPGRARKAVCLLSDRLPAKPVLDI